MDEALESELEPEEKPTRWARLRGVAGMTPGTDEPVFTVYDFYDGPRGGVAHCGGVPHVYRSLFLDFERDAEGTPQDDVFLLKPINPRLYDLALEDWAIFLRWRAAFDAGEVDLSTHPALPQDRPRHDEIHEEVRAAMEVDASDPEVLRATASFTRTSADRASLVRWSRLDS